MIFASPDNTHADKARSRIERDALTWVLRLAAGAASGKAGACDLEKAMRWASRSKARKVAFADAYRVWKILGEIEPDSLRQHISSFHGTSNFSRINMGHRPRLITETLGRRRLIGGVLAASAAAVAVSAVNPPFGLWPSWSEVQADYRTRTGQQRQIFLSDNVKIEMNTRTSLDISSQGSQLELISGEIMVSASRQMDEPFVVMAAGGRIVTNNATFNARYTEDKVCVTCVTGTIRIHNRDAVLAVPQGYQAAYAHAGGASVSAANTAIVTAWQDREVVFESTPISDVVEEINRYRPGRVIIASEALGRRRLNASFPIGSMDEALEAIQQIYGAHAVKLPGGIIVLS